MPNLANLGVNYVFEPRPVPRLAAAPTAVLNPLIGGGSIGTGPKGAGTLGGILKDPSGAHYGLTCAHVASANSLVDHPSQQDAGGPRRIGRVTNAQLPTVYPPGLPLTPANQAANSNDVDVALVLIDKNVSSRLEVDTLGPIAGLFPRGSIQQWHPTVFAGRTSGVRSVEFRTPVAFYNVPGPSGGTICFNDLFEIQWSPGVGQPGPPIQAGDSGAWLCISGPSGYELAAMVVAWDPHIGFAVSASALERWWKGVGFANLQPM
ncbi:MAG TPA: hypothetical protein VN578_12415 [Candidatus Binatia bacterium]|nr:hypothetical protein [Candidatus Binatia bacterium]